MGRRRTVRNRQSPNTVGDTAGTNGVETTFTGYSLDSTLAYVPRRSDERTAGTSSDDRETKTVEAGNDRQWPVVLVEIANVADGPERAPAPGGSADTDGEIRLESKEAAQVRTIPTVQYGVTDGEAIDGAYRADGEGSTDSRSSWDPTAANCPLASRSRDGHCDHVSAPFDASEVKLVALTNPNGANERFVWEFTPA